MGCRIIRHKLRPIRNTNIFKWSLDRPRDCGKLCCRKVLAFAVDQPSDLSTWKPIRDCYDITPGKWPEAWYVRYTQRTTNRK
jgi:hypothetical protein